MPKRNELCPCGSNKKYKKCCLPKQRDAENKRVHYERYQRLIHSPCPCKSGKKLKDCCLGKNLQVMGVQSNEAFLLKRDTKLTPVGGSAVVSASTEERKTPIIEAAKTISESKKDVDATRSALIKQAASAMGKFTNS